MRKFLSIIIPSYKETEADIFPLLSSISIQTGVDFNDIEIILVRDGTPLLNESFIAQFPVKIRQIAQKTNGGPGLARQFGLENSSAEYVLFCDADDRLQNTNSLAMLLNEVDVYACDMLGSKILEETRDQFGKPAFVERTQENTWMHGKVIRRQFLNFYNIRFHPDLRVHEDTYFLAVCACAAREYRFLDRVTYLWCWRDESITRRNNASYTYDSMDIFIKSCSLAYDKITEFNPQALDHLASQLMVYIFFNLHRSDWLDTANDKNRAKTEAAFKKWMTKHWGHVMNYDATKGKELYCSQRDIHFKGEVESESLHDWLVRVGMTPPSWAK